MTLPRPIAPPLPAHIDTPRLVIDLDVVERNARRMADAMNSRGVPLRPHVKTHKSVAIARIQLEHGARGITVGTLGEGEVMADGGIDDIFLAYPVWAAGAKGDRLRALAERPALRFAVGLDSVAAAQLLGRALSGSRATLRVVIEVDPHYGRTGIAVDKLSDVARAAQQAGLDVCGAFVHGGHGYADPETARATAAEDEIATLTAAGDALRELGVAEPILSAGSSPTALGAARPPVTEMRAGTYVIGDRQQVALGASPPDGVAIAVATTVVSTSVPRQIVINAGAKSLTKDLPPYLAGYGTIPAYPDGIIERVSDYHGQVRFPAGARVPELGETVAV